MDFRIVLQRAICCRKPVRQLQSIAGCEAARLDLGKGPWACASPLTKLSRSCWRILAQHNQRQESKVVRERSLWIAGMPTRGLPVPPKQKPACTAVAFATQDVKQGLCCLPHCDLTVCAHQDNM